MIAHRQLFKHTVLRKLTLFAFFSEKRLIFAKHPAKNVPGERKPR
jgi:hypothetical protein